MLSNACRSPLLLIYYTLVTLSFDPYSPQSLLHNIWMISIYLSIVFALILKHLFTARLKVQKNIKLDFVL